MIPVIIVVAAMVVAAALLYASRRQGENKKGASEPKKPPPESGEVPLVDKLWERLRALPGILSPPQELTYEEAMKYFIAHKKDAPEIAKGAMLKYQENGALTVAQVFLDKNNNLVEKNGQPLGCKRKVSRLDAELLALFKNNDLVIVE